MIKAMQIICALAMVLDLIVFFMQSDIRYLFMAGIMFVCFISWMRRE